MIRRKIISIFMTLSLLVNTVPLQVFANSTEGVEETISNTYISDAIEVAETDYAVDFKINSDSGRAFDGEMSITNKTDKVIKNWILEFDFNRTLEKFESTEVIEHRGDHYVIKNTEKNAEIKPGERVILAFNGYRGPNGNNGNKGNKGNNGNRGNKGNKDNNGSNGNSIRSPKNYQLKQLNDKDDDGEIDYFQDTDEDGLSDYLEKEIGTDPNNPDTDSDGLPDGYEYYVLGTDPLKKDTNSNGVNDGEEDFDDDGLTNLQEYSLNGNPFRADTDSDGLDDHAEYLLGTMLDERDSDSDGLSDGKEIELGLDPLNPDSNENGILDGDEILEVIKTPIESETDPNVVPTIKLDLPGELIDTLEITKVSSDNWYIPKEMPGYIGAGYEFNLGGEFEEAELSFEFNIELLEEPDFEPAIYYVDEVNQEMILLEDQEIDLTAGTVTAAIHHFSKYILLNKTDFENGFKEEIKLPTDAKNLDIVFVIDRSYSMDWNDPNDIRKEVAKELVSSLEEEDRVGVVSFSKVAYNLLDLTTDKTKATTVIDSIVNNNGYGTDAGTALHRGLRTALTQFSTDSNTYPIIVALTDGEDTVTGNYNSIIEEAANKGIIIHTVGLTAVDDTLLSKISADTGGEYFKSADAEGLREEFEKIRNITVDFTKDSDGDGLSDYHEQRIRIFNGTYKNTDIENPDTDGDDIPDGDEIIPVYKTENGVEMVDYYKLLSDPTMKDSDNDGIDDLIDPDPLSYNITDRTLALVAGLSYSNLSKHVGKTVGELTEANVSFKNLEPDYAAELKNARIIQSNQSGLGWLRDLGDGGLGSVAVQISRPGKKDAVIYGLRGTEFKDILNDGQTDILLFGGWSTKQSKQAFLDYTSLAANKNRDYFISGHSLGGRLTQDVNYKIYNRNYGLLAPISKSTVKEPVHSATFNGLGYNKIVYKTLQNKVLEKYENKLHNYYYRGDLVGDPKANYSTIDAGKDMGAWAARIDGQIEGEEILPEGIHYKKVHGINLWHYDQNLRYKNIPIIQ